MPDALALEAAEGRAAGPGEFSQIVHRLAAGDGIREGAVSPVLGAGPRRGTPGHHAVNGITQTIDRTYSCQLLVVGSGVAAMTAALQGRREM